jgi:hypothetical protein
MILKILQKWGNHEMTFKDNAHAQKTLSTYTNTQNDKEEPLFTGIKCHEALVLVQNTNQNCFGHTPSG